MRIALAQLNLVIGDLDGAAAAIRRAATQAVFQGADLLVCPELATLGGYLNRRHDPPPGATVIWRGFLVLHEITEMFRIFASGP